jgi:hypothetical protein
VTPHEPFYFSAKALGHANHFGLLGHSRHPNALELIENVMADVRYEPSRPKSAGDGHMNVSASEVIEDCASDYLAVSFDP